MSSKKPVVCPVCGAQIRKSGYCSNCYMHISIIKKAYNTSDYYYNMGLDKAIARDLSGAIESLNMSLRYNKKNIMTRNLLGLIYYEMGEVVMALSHWVMSVNYKSSGNLATKYLKELRSNPTTLADVDQIAIKYNMALDYAKRDDIDLAIIQLKNLLSKNGHFVKGYLLLALLYIHFGNYEKARVTLRRVLKIDKANPLAIHYLHEMGDTDMNIIQMRMEEVEDDGLLEEEYIEENVIRRNNSLMDEDPSDKKSNPIKDFFEKCKNTLFKKKVAGDISFAKYSGVYVLVGMVLGVLMLGFIIVPAQRKSLRKENERIIKTYSEEIAAKESTITSLDAQVSDLNRQIARLESNNSDDVNPLPDYTYITNGMTDEDIQNMINNE
ncbi:MAG: tetratricopeptide repeat protein [Lachnospiraceae bacterium]|nr:tetratricopeptide repeat protein [Lachnospiraceae bacterium]